MSLISFIGSRFNARATLPRSIRLMRAVAISGIAVAVAALVVATSIGRGFEGKYRRALLDFNAHVILMGSGELTDLREAEAAVLSLTHDSSAEEEAANASMRYLPLIDAARTLLGSLSALHGRINLLFMDTPWAGNIMQAFDPSKLKGLAPEGFRRTAARADDAASKGVIGRTPFLYREALALGGGKISGVIVKGVDPESMKSVNAMPVTLFGGAGSLKQALAARDGSPPRAIAGGALARSLGAQEGPKRVKLLVPRENNGKGAEHRFNDVEIVGIFDSGMHDYDAQFLLLDLPDVRRLFGATAGAVTGVELKLDDPDKATKVAARLDAFLGPHYKAVTWGELNRELFAAVRLEQLVSALIMGIMVVVAALNIVAVLVLMTIYRFHEISVLKALGLRNRQVAALLTRGGATVGLAGAAAGLALGIALALAIGHLELIPLEAEIYLIGALPIDISPFICGMIALFCLAVGFLTSRFASKKLAGVPIAEGLHVAR